MKVAFFGTSNRSHKLLNSLKEDKKLKLVLCITKTDIPVGRKQKLQPTGVKVWAKQNGVQYLTIDSMDPANTAKIVKGLMDKKIDIGAVADFSFIIPWEIISTPKHGLVNIHFSLLPKYRGAAPVQFAILNGDLKTGVTYLLVTEGLDEGPILHQFEYNLDGTETSGFLYKRLFELAAEKLPQVIKDYVKGRITPKEQFHSLATYTFSKSHPKNTYIYKEDAKIDWSKDPKIIERQVRAYIPWPVAWTTLEELANTDKLNEKITLKAHVNKYLTIKVYKASIINRKLQIQEVQVEGKNKMSWDDFRNGYVEQMRE